jgi:diguanylate cyclase (GGDEF)-like protein
MKDQSLHRFIRTLIGTLWLLTWAYTLVQCSREWGNPPDAILARLLLFGLSICTDRFSRSGSHPLVSALLVPQLALWPDAWSLLAGMAVFTSRLVPRRFDRDDTLSEGTADSVAWSISFVAVHALSVPEGIEPLAAVGLRCGLIWLLFEAGRRLVVLPMRAITIAPEGAVLATRWEWLNLPIACAVALGVTHTHSAVPLAFAFCIPALQQMTVRLDRVRHKLSTQQDSLQQRTSEVLTLQSLGREMLSHPDGMRLGSILDRECRKLFDPEGFCYAIEEEGQLQHRYRRDGERILTNLEPIGPDFESWLREQKRADQWRAGENGVHYEPQLRAARSALIAPLLARDRVAGVITLESQFPDAFSDHDLVVLTAVAQQAAATWEASMHQRRATVDSLTGYFVRDYYFNRVEEEFRRAARYRGKFSLLMIDLDGFKQVNDHHGHQAGDQYLREVAATIRERLRDADLPCRYGGDEFSVLLPETDLGGACKIAERIREAVARQRIESGNAILRGTVSIGVASYPDHAAGSDVPAMLKRADEALYRAKRGGRDRVVTASN